jgi:activating signal cointegrator complex subunit 1
VLGSKQSEALIIKGSSKAAVASARMRTQLLIDSVISSRMLDYTHFVSIPLANPQTAAKLQDFQAKVGGCRLLAAAIWYGRLLDAV